MGPARSITAENSDAHDGLSSVAEKWGGRGRIVARWSRPQSLKGRFCHL